MENTAHCRRRVSDNEPPNEKRGISAPNFLIFNTFLAETTARPARALVNCPCASPPLPKDCGLGLIPLAHISYTQNALPAW